MPRNAAPPALFQPYVSSRSGEDRAVVFASTSADPFGSSPAGAACTLTFRGSGAPAGGVFALPSGTVRAFLLSRGAPAIGIPAAPGFQGFLETRCDAGLVRAADYRVTPDPSLKGFCEIDAEPGVQTGDVVALTGMLGQLVGIGHAGDPDGDGAITSDDVQYCNGQSGGVQAGPGPGPSPGPDPTPNPEPGPVETPAPSPSPSPAPAPVPAPQPSSGADLRVAWTASERETRPKRPLTLTAHVTNAGPSAAPGAAALLYPPSGLVISRSPRECSEESGLWRCELGVLAAGQTILLELAGSVATFASRELVAAAEVRSTAPDPNLANNSTSITVPLETQVDLSVSAYILPRFPAPGETATLTISATNRGPAWAENVVLTAELAAAIELVRTPSGCSLSGRQLRCVAGTLPTGRTRAYLLQVRLRTGSGFQGGGASGFLADVTGASTTPEYAPANNSIRLVQ